MTGAMGLGLGPATVKAGARISSKMSHQHLGPVAAGLYSSDTRLIEVPRDTPLARTNPRIIS